MTPVLEHVLIGRLAAGLPRSPAQLNGLHESDAELVRLPGGDLVLALTTDALAEEIATGLYADPWLIGWMLVTVNASDLAAVGAEPLGLLLCETLPPGADGDWIAALQRGIADASGAYGLPVLGGDTNAGRAPHLAATAVGLLTGQPVTRCGARAGDLLFASGPLGTGGAYALAQLMRPGSAAEVPFRPLARLAEGRALRGIASACMDTSDGAIATLDELMARSGVGFRLEAPLSEWTDPVALATIRAAGLPPWMLHAGPHGEFELLFTVPLARIDQLHRAGQAADWQPLLLGLATAEPGLRVPRAGGCRALDTTAIRNLFAECGGGVREYVSALARMLPEGE
jgi:thiamine-monophosphate kinase